MPKAEAGIHAEDIKARLRKAYGSITHLSRAWGFSRSAITNTLSRQDYSLRLERRIAAALDLSPHDIWPTRWSIDGSPLPRSARQNTGPIPPVETSQKRKAA